MGFKFEADQWQVRGVYVKQQFMVTWLRNYIIELNHVRIWTGSVHGIWDSSKTVWWVDCLKLFSLQNTCKDAHPPPKYALTAMRKHNLNTLFP